ncbi:hypothetical protein CTI12_AA622970 [Artemisia annua]|uniref:Uncharacterized protein n=1 Tax=Artemisia annua TaxID=35608 RepID=A0A2U1KB98_ARTAN|nr:hypothetical protein CTI12_AA622970 [Artemisia annua]
MDAKRQIYNQIDLDVDADVKTVNRITSLMSTLLADIEGRNNNMEEITKLPRSELRDQAFSYNLMLNGKDVEKQAKLEDILNKIWAIIDMKMEFLKQILEM